MPPNATPTRRTPAEAAELRAALRIPVGVPSVIEFFDFQCPPCRMTYPSTKAVLARHPDFLYRPVNFPLAMLHPYAFGAAVASDIAVVASAPSVICLRARQSLISRSQNGYLMRRGFLGILGTVAAQRYEHKVEADIALGKETRVQGTPSIFVLSANGDLVEVRGISQLESAL